MPGMLLRWITSSKLSPEKPPTLLGMPSGGTTLIQMLYSLAIYALHFLCDLYSAFNFLGVTMSASKSKLSYIA
jgi:hypothetical protein